MENFKLDDGEFEYKKVYDIDKNIKVMNIEPNLGSSVHFLDYNDTLYWLMDSNIDNKPIDSYDMFLDAIYESHTLVEDYLVDTLGKKVDYDFMSTYVYSKDNILYYKNRGNERYPALEK